MNGIKNGKPYSVARVVGTRSFGQDVALFDALNETDQWIVNQWLDRNYQSYPHRNQKSIQEKIQTDTGVAIQNNQVKDALLIRGIKPLESTEWIWRYAELEVEPEAPLEEKLTLEEAPRRRRRRRLTE